MEFSVGQLANLDNGDSVEMGWRQDAMTDEATQYLGLDWLAMCLTFGAIYLLGNKRRAGFLIMSTGNLCWSAIGLWAGSYAMVIANLGFLAMNLRGYAKWRPNP